MAGSLNVPSPTHDAYTGGSSLWPASPAARSSTLPARLRSAQARQLGAQTSPPPAVPLRARLWLTPGVGSAEPCAFLRAPAFVRDSSSAHVPARFRACSLPRSVGPPRPAPRRPRRRFWHTAHLLPLSPPPPPGLDGGPRPTSGTHKKETRRRRRRHP